MIYRYAIVRASDMAVTNVTDVDSANTYHPGNGLLLIRSDTANIGDIYTDGAFVPPDLVPDGSPRATIEPIVFDRLVTAVLGDVRASTIMESPKFLRIMAAASSIDYSDVFVITDDGFEGGYALMVMDFGLATQGDVDALIEAWPKL